MKNTDHHRFKDILRQKVISGQKPTTGKGGEGREGEGKEGVACE